jgi:hypothetical protein
MQLRLLVKRAITTCSATQGHLLLETETAAEERRLRNLALSRDYCSTLRAVSRAKDALRESAPETAEEGAARQVQERAEAMLASHPAPYSCTAPSLQDAIPVLSVMGFFEAGRRGHWEEDYAADAALSAALPAVLTALPAADAAVPAALTAAESSASSESSAALPAALPAVDAALPAAEALPAPLFAQPATAYSAYDGPRPYGAPTYTRNPWGVALPMQKPFHIADICHSTGAPLEGEMLFAQPAMLQDSAAALRAEHGRDQRDRDKDEAREREIEREMQFQDRKRRREMQVAMEAADVEGARSNQAARHAEETAAHAARYAIQIKALLSRHRREQEALDRERERERERERLERDSMHRE